MSEPETKTRLGWRLLYLLIGLALFYAVTFGPVVYGVIRLDKTSVGKTQVVRYGLSAIVAVYYPHLVLMAFTDSYYAYGGWWIRLAGEPFTISRQEMKRRMHS